MIDLPKVVPALGRRRERKRLAPIALASGLFRAHYAQPGVASDYFVAIPLMYLDLADGHGYVLSVAPSGYERQVTEADLVAFD